MATSSPAQALGGGHHVGVPAYATPVGRRAARRWPPSGPPQADQVPALVEREVAPARVGVGVVFLEAVLDVLGLGLDRDPHAHADVVGILRPSGSSRRSPRPCPSFQHAALALRPRDEGDVLHAGRRVQQAVARHRGPVALDTAVDSMEGLEPSRKLLNIFGSSRARGLLGRQAVVAPHRLGRGLRRSAAAICGRGRRPPPESRRCAPSRPGRRSAPAGRRRPASTRRRPRRPALRQQRAAEGIGLDGDVDDVLPCANAARQWSTAATGLPVHSTMTSMAGGAPAPASRRRRAWRRSSSPRPSQSRPACAAPPSRRARGWRRGRGRQVGDATRCTPGVRGICARYIGAELAGADQADAASAGLRQRRCRSLACRFMVRLPSWCRRSVPGRHQRAARHAVLPMADRPG